MQKSYGKSIILISLLIALYSHGLGAATKVLKVENLSTPNSVYSEGLLRLALSYSSNKYLLEPEVDATSQTRTVQYVNSGRVDVLWSGTSDTLEKQLRPIRIPLYRGLLGHRVLMIREGTQHLFNRVETLDDLTKLPVGQGSEWPDTDILEANGFNVVKILRYEHLFSMLQGGRFDAFPRGVQEPWLELETRSDMNLTVEKKLLLVYHMPYYFFVAKDNVELQRDIESGLEKAIEDGSFNEYFFNSPIIKATLEKADLKNRKPFYLKNPLLTPETPLDRKELWLDPLNF